MLKYVTFDGDVSSLNSLMEHFEKLNKVLADTNKIISKEQEEQFFFVKEGNKIIRLIKNEILYIEGYGDYVKIHRTNNKVLLSHCSLKRLEEQLGSLFCRVHRSYIVSIQHINYIEHKRIRIGNNIIPISDSYLPMVIERLNLQE